MWLLLSTTNPYNELHNRSFDVRFTEKVDSENPNSRDNIISAKISNEFNSINFIQLAMVQIDTRNHHSQRIVLAFQRTLF